MYYLTITNIDIHNPISIALKKIPDYEFWRLVDIEKDFIYSKSSFLKRIYLPKYFDQIPTLKEFLIEREFHEDEYLLTLPSGQTPDICFLTLLPIIEKIECKREISLKTSEEIILYDSQGVYDLLKENKIERVFRFETFSMANDALLLLRKNVKNFQISLAAIDSLLSVNFIDQWGWFYYKLYEEYEEINFSINSDINFLTNYINNVIEHEELLIKQYDDLVYHSSWELYIYNKKQDTIQTPIKPKRDKKTRSVEKNYALKAETYSHQPSTFWQNIKTIALILLVLFFLGYIFDLIGFVFFRLYFGGYGGKIP